MKLLILHGPNLHRIGDREPKIYGHASFDDFYDQLQKKYPQIAFTYFQSNLEGALIDKLYEVETQFDGVILNAGGYTHTSVALADAVKTIDIDVIEIHISNIFAREEFRHISLIAPHCKGSISGFGLKGYQLAVDSFL